MLSGLFSFHFHVSMGVTVWAAMLDMGFTTYSSWLYLVTFGFSYSI